MQGQITNAPSRPMAVTGKTIASRMSQNPSVSIHPQLPESEDGSGTRHTFKNRRHRMADRTMRNAKPRITLTAADHEKLSALAEAALHTMPDVARELTDELDRAHILREGKQRADAVHMGCEVDFRDDTTGRVQTVTLVYPHEADISKGRISVLTPIGTALIGLPLGQSLNWTTRTGELKRLTVLQIRNPAVAEKEPV
ncbi:nucleoside diphosphate kinase regulator [Microvirga soli]|uniref:nucleoside diphosphate kinase regulator n=1 Tax=Microvirga soli TaxID=1854496 RepID=UPI0035E4169F